MDKTQHESIMELKMVKMVATEGRDAKEKGNVGPQKPAKIPHAFSMQFDTTDKQSI